MRVLLIKEKDAVQRYEVADEDFKAMERNVYLTCEGHNDPKNQDDWWEWGEEGTVTDPTLTPEDRLAISTKAEKDRKDSLTYQEQADEFEAVCDAIATDADSRERKAKIRGQVFDAQEYFNQKSSEAKLLYDKLI